MKRLLISLVTLMGVCWTGRAQITLNAGDVFRYSFLQLSYVGLAPTLNYAEVLVTLDKATVAEGDMMLLEMFEHYEDYDPKHLDQPLCSQIWTWDSTPSCRVPSLGITGPWHDFNGRVRFSMLSGSVVMKSFTLTLFLGRGGINTWWSDTIVPGPRASIAIAGAAQAQVRWPTNAPGYTLEFASSLPASVWSSVSNNVEVIGSDYVVTLERDAAARFFRLRKL